jgi:GxxExxY protein
LQFWAGPVLFFEGWTTLMLLEEELTEQIIASAMEVHREMGPGLLESAYCACLAREFDIRGIQYRPQVPLPVVYKGLKLDCGYIMDFVVEDKAVLEIKAVEKIIPVFEAQLLTYLKLSGYRVGLLINFNVPVLKNGIVRRVL